MIIRDSVDPLSEASITNEGTVRLARSESMRVLQDELERYCKRQIQGRSFLIAGHRGAGKTMLVSDAILQNMAGDPRKGVLRPLPVFLHGPSLLHTLPSDMRRDEFSLADVDATRTTKLQKAAPPTTQETDPPARAPLQAARPGGAAVPQRPAHVAGPTDDASGAESPDFTEAQERRVQQGLVHMILCLHRAVTREFSRHYREAVLERGRDSIEARELAARFEVELLEDPRASRLREFWDLAGALNDGVLIKSSEARAEDQGMRELVALNGMCNAHQRISGALSQTETDKAQRQQDSESKGGFDAKAVDAFKPLGAILAGSLVAGGGAIGTDQLLVPSLFGVLTAWIGARFLQSTVTTTVTRTRTTDQTFIPDLTPRTLDRILPTLLDRLRNAGLAPVLIVDELDKVADLPNRIERLVSYLKKLVAENVFSCFLTDRSYFEYLRAGETAGGKYSRSSSYFTHRIMVAYGPREIDAYLNDLIAVTPTDSTEKTPSAVVNSEEIDRTVLRWVLRHRSQLHGLSLQREISTLRGPKNVVNIPQGAIRSDYQYLIDLTMQVAIELTLYSKEVHAWRQRQPAMAAALHDSLYYLSRSWMRGDETIDVTSAGTKTIIGEIVDRINFSELQRSKDEPAAMLPPPLGADDEKMLRDVVARVAILLSHETTRDAVDAQWKEICSRLRWGSASHLSQEVLVALLVGEQSLLVSEEDVAVPEDPELMPRFPGAFYRWRYWRSGIARPELVPDIYDLGEPEKVELRKKLAFFRSCSASLGDELTDPGDISAPDAFGLLGDVFRVINTTPAWSQVRNAMENVEQVLAGSGDLMSLKRDVRTIQNFDAVLRSGAPAVAKLLFCSAFISGLASKDARAIGIRACATLISTGLRFAHLKPEDVLTKISEFQSSLVQKFPELNQALSFTAGNAIVDVCGDTFLSAISDCSSAGEAASVDWVSTTTGAWVAMTLRMNQREQDVQATADMQEILCAARGVGPGLFLNLDLGRATLHEWTRVLLRSLNARKRYGTEDQVPATMSVHALFQLGGRNLPLDHVEKIVRKTGIEELDVNVLFSYMRRRQDDVVAPTRAAIVVRRAQQSVTSDWHPEPGLGVVLVVDHTEDLETAFAIASEANPQRPVRIVFEEPAGDPPELARLMKKFGSPPSQKFQAVFMTRDAFTPDMRTPVIVDPSGPDAVFRRPRESRNTNARPS